MPAMLTLLLTLALVIVIDYYLAKWFYEVVEAKGYHNKKYFWICFLFAVAGYLLVIALPDRGNAIERVGEALPELNDLPEL